MSFLRKLFRKQEPLAATTTRGYTCQGCGKTLAGDDLAYAKKRETDSLYFYGEIHSPGMPAKIIQVMDVRDKTFYCQSCLDSTATWAVKDKLCMNCQSFMCNVVRMNGVADFYCAAQGNMAINDPLTYTCPSWQVGKPFKKD